tara:strand:+ start:4731 stop:6035 length:1305 start_codon:yes stop_codon:yes gene_type:complete
MFTTTNAKHVLVAGNVARTASASTDPNSADYIANTELVIVSSSGIVLNTTTVLTQDTVRLCQRSQDEVFYSPMITAKNIASYKGSAFTTDLEQISYLGYNGVSGSIDAIASNDYLVRVIRQDTQAFLLNKEMLKFGAYRSLASTSEEAIAKGLTESLIANFARQTEREIRFERVCNDAGAIIPTGTGTAAVTAGSTLVTFSVAVDNATGATLLLVGEYLRFGTAVTDPLYKIVSIDVPTETLTLDIPYQGVSNGAVANNTIERITAVLGAAADFGIKMTGLPLKFKRGVFAFTKVRFAITLADFGATTMTDSQAASEGNGTWQRSEELEWFASEGAHGKIERIGTPPPESKKDVVQGNGYSTLYLSFSDKSASGIQGTPESKIETIILLDKGVVTAGTPAGFGGQVTGAVTDIVDVLDAWVVAKGVGSLQTGNI